MILEEGGYVLLIWGYHQVYLVYAFSIVDIQQMSVQLNTEVFRG